MSDEPDGVLGTLRVTTVADVAAMHAVRTGVLENQLSNPGLVTRAHYVALLAGAGRGWVYEVAGAVVGFGMADAGRRNIWALFVLPAFERRGIGRALLDEMVTWLSERSGEPVWLTTGPGTRAERFYRAAGWREAGRTADGELRFELTPGSGPASV